MHYAVSDNNNKKERPGFFEVQLMDWRNPNILGAVLGLFCL